MSETVDATLLPAGDEPTGESDEQVVTRFLGGFEADLKAHDVFAAKVDRNYRSYRGLLETRSDANAWQSSYHPAYVLQSIETMVASLIESSPKFKIRATPRMASREERQRYLEGAKANQILLNDQLCIDHFPEKQRVIDLQGLIAGLTVTKQRWNFLKQPVRQRKFRTNQLLGLSGDVIAELPYAETETTEEVVHDDPTIEAVDVRDFVWHEGAVSLAKCARVWHRSWYTLDELRELECRVEGRHHPDECDGMYHNVDAITETRDFSAGVYNREQDLFQVNRSKGQVEVVEGWVEHGRRLVAIANRKLLLRDVPNPYWFDRLEHRFPFSVCSSMPDLFRIPGISEVELMRDIQEMVWSLQNQRLDNVQLMSNAISIIRDDIEDPDELEFYPGARWLVPGDVNNAVQMWSPNPQILQMTLESESSAKKDMMDVTGGMPWLSGDTASLGGNTATEASIVTNLAQRRLAARKLQFTLSHRRIAEQWCAMNQQFMTGTRLVPMVGRDGADAFVEIRPEIIQGAYVFETEMLEESLMRQERRSEAQARLQVIVEATGALLPWVQARLIPAPNLKKYVDDYNEAFDADDPEAYWINMPPQQTPAGPPGPASPLPPGGPQAPQNQLPPGLAQVLGQAGSGVTAPQATDPNSPSNATSQSPAVFQQRMGAMSGPTQ